MMFTQSGRIKKFAKAIILVTLSLFAACGGEDGETETEYEFVDNSSNDFICYSAIDFYNDPATCGGTSPISGSGNGNATPPPNVTGGTTPPPSGSGIAALFNDEIEANNTLANANIMSYPTRSASITHIGWVANGSISDMMDDADYFSFTAPIGRDYTIRLCPPSGSPCSGTTGIDTLTAFFEMLDQDGNVLLSSQAAPTNAYEMAIDAGVVYYVRVMAGDTMGSTVSYSFQAFERK
jgi:hypothetical protein